MRGGVQSLLLQHRGVAARLAEFFASSSQRGIMIASKWAGIGTSTACVLYVQEALAHVADISMDCDFYAAFDNASHCQDILIQSRCRHVFSDVCLGSDTDWLEKLKHKNNLLLGELQKAKSIGSTALELRRVVRTLNNEYKEWIAQHRHEFSHDPHAVGQCARCQQNCRLRLDDGVNVEIVSPTCVSWSAQ